MSDYLDHINNAFGLLEAAMSPEEKGITPSRGCLSSALSNLANLAQADPASSILAYANLGGTPEEPERKDSEERKMLKLEKEWNERLRLVGEGEKLWAEGKKLWLDANNIRAEGTKACTEVEKLLRKSIKLRASGEKLRGNAYKLWGKGDRLRGMGDMLCAEGDILWADGSILWAEAVLKAYGDIKMEWGLNGDCRLENGEVYKA